MGGSEGMRWERLRERICRGSGESLPEVMEDD